jgi:hypothetical protein
VCDASEAEKGKKAGYKKNLPVKEGFKYFK